MLLMPPMYNFSYGVNNLESHHKRFSCKQLVNCKMVLSNFKPYSEVKENSHVFGDNFRELLDDFYFIDRITRYACCEKKYKFL